MNNTLILGIVGHLVGDYLLQTDWMALNKKLRSWPCFVHCAIWTACVCIFTGWGWIPAAFLLTCHFVQDRTQIVKWWMTLKWKSQVGFMQPPFAPWSLIVVDNVWHIVQLWVAWRFLV
jgi:hypothetical protein